MKKLLPALTVLCIPIFIWNCEKEVKYNRIEGTLEEGMEINLNSLDSIPLALVKIYDTIDFANVELTASNFEHFYSALSDESGYYYFDSLPDGKYLLACGEGFKFADVDYLPVTAADGSVTLVNKMVIRIPLKNGPDTYNVELLNSSKFKMERIEFFSGETSLVSYEINLEPGENLGGGMHLETQLWYHMILDADQEPTFQLTLVGSDTTMLTEKYWFFDGYFKGHGYFIAKIKDWDGNEEKEYRLCLTKGWFFGHWITLYCEGLDFTFL